MLNENILVYVLTIFIIFVCIQIYRHTPYFHLKCVISDENGNTYCVRERELPQEAVELLARIDERCKALVKYIGEQHPEKESVKRLTENFKEIEIQEILPSSTLTAYTENKGERMAFCLQKSEKSEEVSRKLIDEELLFFVAMHELSHVMTKSVGHTKEFWDNFKFILTEANKANMYVPVDYEKTPKEYCGMNISNNPYFDE